MFDYLVIENIKVNNEVEDDGEDKKLNEGSAANDKDIALLNQTVEALKKDIQEVTDEKLAVMAQNEKMKLERVSIASIDILTFLEKYGRSILQLKAVHKSSFASTGIAEIH